jgi:hypothetical protein
MLHGAWLKLRYAPYVPLHLPAAGLGGLLAEYRHSSRYLWRLLVLVGGLLAGAFRALIIDALAFSVRAIRADSWAVNERVLALDAHSRLGAVVGGHG